MYAVGRLGSYITQGVYTVSGPFHPFGGAVDIIVVEQPDGSFKSSPWYVRFGKFQGVLKAREQVVTINVNGIETNIQMYLDPRGEAYFLRELEGEEGESVSYRSSSSDDMDEQSQKNRRPMKSKSCNYDGSNSNSGDQINASNGNILARNTSRQSRISGLVLGQRSIKEDGYQEGGDGAGVVKISSLEHAEIAANLVEKFVLNESDLGEKLVEISEISRKIDEPSLQYADEDIDVEDVIPEVTCSDSDIADTFEACPGKKLDEKQASDEKDVLLGFRVSEKELVEISEISRKIDEPSLQNADQDNDAEDAIPEVICSDSEIADVFEAFPGKKLDEKQSSVERDVELPGFRISEEESESSIVQSFIDCEISESSTVVLEGSKEQREIADVFEACPREKLGEKLAPDERDVVLPGFGASEKESGSSSIQSFIHFETSDSSTVVLDGSKEQSEEIADVFEACPGVSVEESGLSSIQSSMHCETSESSVVVLDGSKEQSEIAGGFEACPDEKLGEKQASDERDVVLPGFGVSVEESGFSSIQSSMHCETSESSVVVLDGSKEQPEIAGVFEACLDEKLGEKQALDERDVVLPGFGVSVEESGLSSIQSSMHCETSESSVVVLDGSKEQSEIAGGFEACPDEKLGEKLASNERDVVLPGFGVSVEESGSSSVQSSIHCETSESSTVGLDGSKEQSEIAGVFEACSGKKGEKQALDERDVELPGFGVSEEESGSSRVQSFIYCETSESSIMGLDGLKGESEETLSLASGGPREVHFCAETLHVTTESLAEDTVNRQAEDIELEREDVESHGGYSQQMDPPSTSMCAHDETNLEASLKVSTSYVQTAYVDPVLGSVEVESKTISFNTSFGNSVNTMQDEIDIGDKITRNELQLSLDSVGDLEQLNGDYAPTKAAPIPVSESSEEEQFFFSDIDDFELRETQGESNFPDTVDEESNFPDAADEENHPSIGPEGQLNGSLNTNDESYSSPDNFVQKNRLSDFENFTENLKLTSSPIDISKRHSVASAEDGRLTESLPDLWSHMDNLGTEDLHHPLSHSLDLNSESLEWELHDKNESPYAKSDTGNESQSAQEYSNKEDTYQLEDIKNGVGNPAVGDPSKAIVITGGSWSLWPFPFRRSRSRKTVQPTVNDTRISDGENVSDSNICTDDNKRVLQRKASKKMVKAMTPTSKELASLNLKEGSNAVMFTFSTAMLGKQKVDARIYLWKWNTRIVISDVDGTITKSDVLGQFMPLVGVDWSQTGVAHLFSAIKDNGYQFLYLSARAIAQAYITRQFLVNLKQDGKALPDGPVVISPDGLFPSLFREVIRRAPHEFKIACLEDIRALFPSDCNPFYAGFGNRDTDEISYLKVGIPRGKIFIINPKGEVAVNRLVDTRSYTSLHALVHGMFPVMTSSEQEDFNSWNFWKLPPPDIDH